MKYLIAAVAALTAASPGVGQATSRTPAPPAKPGLWSGEVRLGLSPRFGREQPFDTTEDLVDESEGELSLTLTRKDALGTLPLSLKAGVVSSPQYLDDADPQSGYYGEVTIGDAFRPLHSLTPRDPEGSTGAVVDALRPYGRYRYTRLHQDFLDDFKRYEHLVTAGLRYRDVRSIMCAGEVPGSAEEAGACSNIPGISWVLRAEVNQVWSSDRNEERLAPSLRADLISHPLAGGVRLFARAQLEARFYEHALVPATTRKREDLRLRATAGVDLSPLVQRWIKDTEFEIGGQFQRRWSNDPSRRHTRFYFVPSLTLVGKF